MQEEARRLYGEAGAEYLAEGCFRLHQRCECCAALLGMQERHPDLELLDGEELGKGEAATESLRTSLLPLADVVVSTDVTHGHTDTDDAAWGINNEMNTGMVLLRATAGAMVFCPFGDAILDFTGHNQPIGGVANNGDGDSANGDDGKRCLFHAAISQLALNSAGTTLLVQRLSSRL